MDLPFIISELESNQVAIDGLLRGTPNGAQHWQPSPKDWCLLEIICHLCDEERDDFRARVRSVLEDPSQPLPLADPQAWVTSRAYRQQNFTQKLDEFLSERQASVEWLRDLRDPQWHNAYQHSKMGPLTAEMFLTNWLAHDHLHIRQINRRKYQYLQATAGVSLDYAGEW